MNYFEKRMGTTRYSLVLVFFCAFMMLAHAPVLHGQDQGKQVKKQSVRLMSKHSFSPEKYERKSKERNREVSSFRKKSSTSRPVKRGPAPVFASQEEKSFYGANEMLQYLKLKEDKTAEEQAREEMLVRKIELMIEVMESDDNCSE